MFSYIQKCFLISKNPFALYVACLVSRFILIYKVMLEYMMLEATCLILSQPWWDFFRTRCIVFSFGSSTIRTSCTRRTVNQSLSHPIRF